MSKLEVLQQKKHQLFLILLSLYLGFYFFAEFLYIKDVYSLSGINTSKNIFFLESIFILIASHTWVLYFLHILKLIFIIMLLFSNKKTYSAIALCFLYFIFDTLSETASPEQSFIQVLLIFIFFSNYNDMKIFNFKNQENLNFREDKDLLEIAWIIFGLAYTVSGYHKFISRDWANGKFILYFIQESYLPYDFTHYLLALTPILSLMTYITLYSEFIALPMIFFKKTRFIIFILLTGLQISLLFMANIPQISFGMLIYHFYLFDLNWLKFFKIKYLVRS